MGKLGDLIIGVSSALISYRFLKSALSRTDAALTRLENMKGTPCPGGDKQCTIRPAGRAIEQRASYIAEQVWNSSLDPEMRRLAMRTLNRKCDGEWCTPPRDHMAEVKALTGAVFDRDAELWDAVEGHFAWVKGNVAYRKDHAYVDQFASAKRTAKQYGGGDCFPTGTLMLRDDYTLVPVEELREGMKIWGRDRWSEVQRVWYKGILPVTVLRLNNGSEVKLTEDHHVFVAHCPRHDGRTNSQACSCPVSERQILRITVSELTEGMVLIAPDRIPFGKTEMDSGRAYVEGLYLSDGWSDRYRFSISGQDGCPKEAQKREVEEICQRLGVKTSWRRKSITVWGKDWALRTHLMGMKAPQKHALDIGLVEEAARELLRGIMADAGDAGGSPGRRGRTLTTTSRMLMIQARLLHRMCGRTCRSSYIEHHGGLGRNPIWRLATRASREDNQDIHAEKLLRVSEIEREVMSVPAWDITTDDHYVYLPEYDVTVSQCDDHTILIGALNLASGFPVGMRIYATKNSANGDFDHIAGLVEVPPHSGNWYVMDASVDKVREGGTVKAVYPGWGAPKRILQKYVDFKILPGGKVKKIDAWP